MERLRSLRDRIGKLSSRSKQRLEPLKLQPEAGIFLASLDSYPTQKQIVTHLVLSITTKLSELTQQVQKTYETVDNIKSELNKAQYMNAAQKKEKEAKLQGITQIFVEDIVDKGMTTVMDQVDEVSMLIDQVREELKALKEPKYDVIGYSWLEEIYKAASIVETFTKGTI
ncbi:hypothetical protein BGX38DRAFT_1175898 [Terfezia claveryi]|nr:hypothetical protein BGX38DRAFT_1175898 [Terfezia claveryi]